MRPPRLLMSLLTLMASVSSPVLAESPPHIVLLVADDLGFNDVSWHNDAVLSPNLASLASQGVTLEQHYSQATCTPTRGALLTGRYPIHTGLHNGQISPTVPYGLNTSFPTLAEELKTGNYATHIIGKWHLGFCDKKYWPTRRGFDHHYGFLVGDEDYYDHKNGNGYDFRNDDEVLYEATGTYSTTLFQDRAVEVIREHDPEKPLFLYVPFQSVHSPLEVPQVYQDLYSDVVDDVDRQKYLGMVTAMDDAVGNITEALKDHDLYDNTVIVFFSDNGGLIQYGANNWPLRGQKSTLFEGGTRTPAFIHSPRYFSPRVEQGMMHVTDWFPTLLSSAGLTPSSDELDGVDQWDALLDDTISSPRQEMIYNIVKDGDSTPTAAIRSGDWKYIWSASGYNGWAAPPEGTARTTRGQRGDITNALFDLKNDPTEETNLADEEPERAAIMLARLEEYLESMSDVTYPDKDVAGYPKHFGGVWSSGWC